MNTDPRVTKRTIITRRKGGLVTLIARNWNLVLVATMTGIVLFALISFAMPQTFEAVTTALPPEREGVGGMLSMLAGSSAALDLLKGSDNPTLDLFKTIIESRTIAEDVARDPKVHNYFGKRDTSFSSIASAVQGTIKSEAVRTGVFMVTVDVKTEPMPSQKQIDSGRDMAAYLANVYLSDLDRFNRDRLLTNARATRIFIEGEYDNRMAQLDSSYRRLQAFQELHKTISLPEQLSATVTAAASLTSKIQQLEMQLGVEQHEMSPNSTHIQMLNEQLSAAKSQLQKYDQGGVGDYVVALKDVPELSRLLANYLRETKVLEQVTAYLRQELEQQRISEQKDMPSLQVLDPAKPPLRRSSPSRTLFVLLGAFVGICAGIGGAATQNFIESVHRRPEEHYRLLNFLNTVRRGDKAKLFPPYKPASTDDVEARQILVEHDEA